MTEKGKPRCLPFILNPPVCLADYQNMSQTSKKKGLCFEGPHSKCCSNRANPGARGGEKKIPVRQFWKQNFHIYLKGTDATLNPFLCHKKMFSFQSRISLGTKHSLPHGTVSFLWQTEVLTEVKRHIFISEAHQGTRKMCSFMPRLVMN